jgi:hypothetical protein
MSAYYRTTLADYLDTDKAIVLGVITQSQTGTTPQQQQAWMAQLEMLESAAKDWTERLDAAHWGLLFEYRMLRLHRRIDLVLLADDLIFVIEFKIGSDTFLSSDLQQTEDYALDLRDFHDESADRIILPILCCSSAPAVDLELSIQEWVGTVLKANADTLADVVIKAYRECHNPQAATIDPATWDAAAYAPVPNIIEAAELLYGAHSVAEIHSALAEQKNLTATSDRLIEIIALARRDHRLVVCFVTGVPGSGKTLTGLNAVHDPRFRETGGVSSAFLSGNTPLVAVLREALAKDHQRSVGGTIAEARRKTQAEIQLLMRYLEEYAERDTQRAPHEYVIVFDEAQRAWDADYGKQKFDREASEPTLFLEIMARHMDWAVIIALVGGGQEINKGEGGLPEWGQSLAGFDPAEFSGKGWDIHASSHVLKGTAVTAGGVIFPDGVPDHLEVITDDRLHLPVSVRSHRCEIANAWIDAVLVGDQEKAAQLAHEIVHFPIYMTRSLEDMRVWLRKTTRGHRRCGLVASSNARRLRGYGLGISLSTQDLSAIKHWFLTGRDDVRSSYALEVTATEYACQGLELDRVGLCWGGDMTWSPQGAQWEYRTFRGSQWQNTRQEEAQQNTQNTYRVLMSRAREALVIWVPPGAAEDPTRPVALMDATAAYLERCGVRELPEGVWPALGTVVGMNGD